MYIRTCETLVLIVIKANLRERNELKKQVIYLWKNWKMENNYENNLCVFGCINSCNFS